MPIASRPMFLRHFGQSGSSRRGPDLADMGTAFALDEAMEDGPGYDTLAPHDSPPPRRAVPVAAWRRWLVKKLGA
ncbi:MAG: hypothetical protein ABW032_00205 [Burkholderiaceae bacterium]